MADESISDLDRLTNLAMKDALVQKKQEECSKSGEELRNALNSYKETHPASVEELLDIRIIREKTGEIYGFYNHKQPYNIRDYLSVPDHVLSKKINEKIVNNVNECVKTR